MTVAASPVLPAIGESATQATLQRVEDARLLRGEGGFVANQKLPDMAHAVFVRSPYAHARITALRVDAARLRAGVLAVLTPADFAGLRQPRVNRLVDEMRLPEAELVPPDRVLSLGAPVALVIAATLHQAQQAAEQVEVDYEELPAVADFDREATALYEGVPGNLVAQTRVAVGSLPAAPASAEVELELPRVAASPLEPRAALMRWDAPAKMLTAWLSTQTPSRAREELAAALGVAADQVRVVATDVGGAFGGKASVFAEDLMLAVAARQIGRPLRWLATRGEDLLAASHGRASRLQGRLWLDASGAMQGLQAQLQFALGHWLTYSAMAPLHNATRILPGPYRLPAWQVGGEARLGTSAAVGIYRGAGRPEACLLMERLVDEAARRQGLDPLEVRLANVWSADELPRTLAHGQWLDRCDLRGLLQHAADLFDYPARRARQQKCRDDGGGDCLIGLGMALYVEPCGRGSESARLTALADGRFCLATGATAQGQGRETAYALIAASALGCAPDRVEVLHGDTAACPPGIGALASRSTAIGGSAVLVAAEQLKAQLAAGAELPLSVALDYHAEHEAWASGCVMVELHIERATGRARITEMVWVDDAGVVVSPDLVRGQLLGGLAQGLGQALLEQLVHDRDGQLLTGSLMDYALPRADDMPKVTIASRPTRSAANPLGAKGVGEAGCIGVPAALLNAAHDALSPWGPCQLQFPLSAARLWQAMRQCGANP